MGEIIIEAIRGAIGTGMDLGWGWGILAFIIIILASLRKKEEPDISKLSSVERERLQRNKTIGGVGAVLIFIFIFIYVACSAS